MSDYLSRTGSVIVILALMVAAVILATQFSFGAPVQRGVRRRRAAARRTAWRAFATWREERRKARQRQRSAGEVRQEGGAGRSASSWPSARPPRRPSSAPETPTARPGRARGLEDEDEPRAPRLAPVVQKKAAEAGDSRRLCRCPNPTGRRASAAWARTPCRRLSLLDAPKAERKIDERELMESARLLEEKCREFAVEGAVVQIHPGPVVTTFEFKPDAGVKYSKVTGLADDLCLAMQAESVLIDRIPGKSTVGHPDSEPEPRGDLAARAAGIGRLHPLDLEADLRAGQDHPRRAVHGRPGDDAPPAHCRLDRLGQVGRPERRSSRASSTAPRRTTCG